MEKKINIKYTQNFLQSSNLIRFLINKFLNISKDDIVVEIGSGRGAITLELCKLAKQVVTYELDYDIYKTLDEKIKRENILNIQLKNEDFLQSRLNTFPSFKVFSNIPFYISADIIRKLLIDSKNLESGCLFLENEAAMRFIGQPYRKESLLSLVLKLNWNIKIVYNFNRTDFFPEPNADVVLISITKKENNSFNRSNFRDLLAYFFNQRKANIKQTLLSLFSFTQTKLIKNSLKLNWEQSARDLSFNQWLEIFNIATLHLSKEKWLIIKGSYLLLNKNKEKQTKVKGLIY